MDYLGVFLTDGLDHSIAVERYKKRRQLLRQRYKGTIVLSGVNEEIGHQFSWLNLDLMCIQDPIFLYFTGLNQYGCAFIIDSEGKETLFLQEQDSNKEFWEGIQIAYHTDRLEYLKLLTGFDEILPLKNLFDTVLMNYKKDVSHPIYTMWYVSDENQKNKEDEFYFKFKLKLTDYLKQSKCDSAQLLSIHMIDTHRLSLDSCDLKNMRTAIQITIDAFKHLCSQRISWKSETDISGVLKGYIQRRSWMGISFPPIVASGKNACALHYKRNNMPLDQNGLLLLDFGCRYEQVVSDMSRTIPINGQFNPLQKLLYQIVLDAQRLVEDHVVAGVSFFRLNELCWTFIENALRVRFLLPGGKMKRHYDRKPHNIGHLIAHHVHDGDPFRHYRTSPLEQGMVITNEPGLYGYFEIEIDDVFYAEYCGIRIEDQLLITKEGCENLTQDCPKSIESIESLLNSSAESHNSMLTEAS